VTRIGSQEIKNPCALDRAPRRPPLVTGSAQSGDSAHLQRYNMLTKLRFPRGQIAESVCQRGHAEQPHSQRLQFRMKVRKKARPGIECRAAVAKHHRATQTPPAEPCGEIRDMCSTAQPRVSQQQAAVASWTPPGLPLVCISPPGRGDRLSAAGPPAGQNGRSAQHHATTSAAG
jgi:hypothetical protein